VNVLFLVPKGTYEWKMSRVRFQQMEALGEIARVTTWGPGWDGWDDGETAACNAERVGADVVVSYQVDGLAGCATPTMTCYNEAFNVERVEREVRANRYRGVVFHHENDLRRYPRWDDDGIVRAHVHHCATEKVYRDYGEAKDIDVLVAGNMSQAYYPHRVRLRDLAWRTLRKRGYRVVVLPHPGYLLPPKPGTVIGEEFARMLNRARLVVTCSMIHKYALAKYSEIALCRSLAVADFPDERPEHFAATVLGAHPWETDAVILDRIEGALDDEEALTKLTDAAWSITRQTSRMESYAERFLDVAKRAIALGPR
jgi:hypothetical protein